MEVRSFNGPMLSPREKLLAENAVKAQETQIEVDRVWEEFGQGRDYQGLEAKVMALSQRPETVKIASGLANKMREKVVNKDRELPKAA